MEVKDGKRTLLYRPLGEPRKDGVIAELVGVKEKGKTKLY